ncbi:uncharacterized [Tachysurus ichikawai]
MLVLSLEFHQSFNFTVFSQSLALLLPVSLAGLGVAPLTSFFHSFTPFSLLSEETFLDSSASGRILDGEHIPDPDEGHQGELRSKGNRNWAGTGVVEKRDEEVS